MKMHELKNMVIESSPHQLRITEELFWVMNEHDKNHLINNLDKGVMHKDNCRKLPARLSPSKAYSGFCHSVKRQLGKYKKEAVYPCYDCMRIAKGIGLIVGCA